MQQCRALHDVWIDSFHRGEITQCDAVGMNGVDSSFEPNGGQWFTACGPGFSGFLLYVAELPTIDKLSVYFTCNFIIDTTKELSLCKQNESV
jgi:hypothetical protein